MGIEIATSEDIAEIKKMMVGLATQVQTLTQVVEAQRKEQMPEWLTVKEAATYLRLTPDTIRRKVRAGHFDTRREGKNILIARSCVLEQSNN
ncbi:helix-turn-helix domain-containing protein [Tateyamaria sp. syn59]|uniref:helix-turn-helix domain-containing protein n=1 Tax=Tateyamaria sp. syn59 TaxID=2576942 RepID=UPI0011BE0DD9|nr:helix-turn-helix domain-containing protein [Tateyamaria sp. syn59]